MDDGKECSKNISDSDRLDQENLICLDTTQNEIASNFLCMLCYGVVLDPVECQKC